MQNPVHVTIIVLLFATLISGTLYARHEAGQDFPVMVRATYESLGGGELPDVEETLVRRRDAAALVDATLRNPLRRPEGIEVCPLQQRDLALRVADDLQYNVSSVRECELEFSNDRFFDLERARYAQYERQREAAEE